MAEDANSYLDISRADRSVWLLKCPHVVAQAWNSTEPGQPLAKITVAVDPNKKDEQVIEKQIEDPTVSRHLTTEAEKHHNSAKDVNNEHKSSIKSEFTMEITAPGSVSAPKSYTLNMSTDIVPMYVFSETVQGKVAVDGKVEHKFDMTPHKRNLEDYRKLCRERTSKSNYKTRKVQVIENDRGGINPMHGMLDIPIIKDKKGVSVPVKTQEMKRTRMDRNELENILFRLFERQPNWTLKQLVTETDQPQQFIKEILSELGIYNKRGTNQGTYELKPEYKKTTAEDAEAE